MEIISNSRSKLIFLLDELMMNRPDIVPGVNSASVSVKGWGDLLFVYREFIICPWRRNLVLMNEKMILAGF